MTPRNPFAVVAMFFAKRVPWFRRMLRTGLRLTRTARVRITARGDVEPRTVLFESFMGRTYSSSPRAVYEHLLTDPAFADWRFVWAFLDPAPEEAAFPQLDDPRTTCISYRKGEYLREAYRCGWWITNSITPDYLPPRPGQHLIQTWHGTPLKRLGADVLTSTTNATSVHSEIALRYAREGLDATYFLSPSDFTTDKFATAFSIADAEKILPIGNPRNDVLAEGGEPVRQRVREEFGIADDKVVVLYAPTWRDDQHSSRLGFVHQFELDLMRLREELGERHVVLFRTHYLVGNEVDLSEFEGFLIDVSTYAEINDLYLASDVLVTDYSSALFDYAVLDRPMVYFMYDLESYRDEVRGLYIDPAELPGPVVTTEAELTHALLTLRERTPQEAAARADFRAEYCTWDDGHASERVARLMLDAAESP